MNKVLALCLCLLSFQAGGQEVLTLEDAISIALEQNYGIQISVMEQEAAEMQVYKSNAGFGPTIDWITNLNAGANYTNQQFLDGRQVNRFGRSYSPRTELSLQLTLYDGGRMQANFDRLGLLGQFSVLQSKSIIQNTVVDVMRAYFNVVLQKETMNYLNNIIQYSQERLKITEERWNVGRGSKIDFLQSQSEINTQRSDLARAENNLKNAKVVLNSLLVREPSMAFDVQQSIPAGDYDLDALIEQAKTQNVEMLMMNKSIEINKKTEQQLDADRKPVVTLNSSFGFSYNNSNTGFLSSSQAVPLNAGVTARWNIFDGKNRNTQLDIAKFNTSIAEKEKESLVYQIAADLTAAFNQYNADKELLVFEEENKKIAEENLSISLEKFRLGGSTILELNEAQRTFDTALNRLVTAQDNIKISELELLRLSGVLVQ